MFSNIPADFLEENVIVMLPSLSIVLDASTGLLLCPFIPVGVEVSVQLYPAQPVNPIIAIKIAMIIIAM